MTIIMIFWAAAPKGMKSCRTQGTFVRLFVCSSIRSSFSGLKSALSGLRSAFSGLIFALSGQKPVLSGLKSTLSFLESALSDSRQERADFRPKRADFRPERTDFRPERAWGVQSTDGQTDRRMNEWKNESPVFYRTSSPLGPLPCLSFRFTSMQSRATGIADHILPLGDLFFVVVSALLINKE